MLSVDQIQKLERLCDNEGITYYDLRQEMVDHLAQGIEERMDADPALKFDDALREVAGNLGVYNFNKIAVKRELEIINTLSRKRNQNFKQFLKIPRIMISLVIALILASPKIFFGVSSKWNIIMVIFISFFFILFGSIYSLFKFKSPQKLLLSLPQKRHFNWGFWLVTVSNAYIVLKNYTQENWFNTPWFILVFSVYTAFSLLFAFAWFFVYSEAYIDAREKYPLAFVK